MHSMAKMMEIEFIEKCLDKGVKIFKFIKSCLQELVFFKNFRLWRAEFQGCIEISIHTLD